ncbi:YisL family protein [Bacillus smithii]|uniref:YisL family protein n=1 Tax=Bacillus smithii TaxID=1479 RepID=UPI0030C96221
MESVLFYNTHLHITTWVITIILFLVALVLSRGQNKKSLNITHMILRLFYVFVFLTGLFLFMKNHAINEMLYGIKLLVGLIVIGMMEMTLVRLKKGKSATVYWIILILAFIAVFYIGFKLPLGFHFFA